MENPLRNPDRVRISVSEVFGSEQHVRVDPTLRDEEETYEHWQPLSDGSKENIRLLRQSEEIGDA